MKYVVLSEDNTVVEGFLEMGVEAFLADEDSALSFVQDALSDESVGTLLVSQKVYKAAEKTIEEHRGKGILPFVMTLDR
jgi:vacuolar-type H+-ATPase subunit F/Vma7